MTEITDLGRIAFKKAVEAGAEAIDDLLVQLGVDPQERPEHGGESIAEVLSIAVLKAGLPCPLRSADHEPHAWGSGSCDGQEVKEK